MFTVLNENELPIKERKYPDLEIGQGFEITPENFLKNHKSTRAAVHNIYKMKKQKIKTMTTLTGSLVVKRIA